MELKTPLKLVRKDNGVCFMGMCEHVWYEIQDREGNPIISNFEYEHPNSYLEMKEIVEKVNEHEKLKELLKKIYFTYLRLNNAIVTNNIQEANIAYALLEIHMTDTYKIIEEELY